VYPTISKKITPNTLILEVSKNTIGSKKNSALPTTPNIWFPKKF
jgi:hypothetical protein